MHAKRRLFFVALVVAVLGFGLAGTAMAVTGRGKVARRVTLAGRSVAGMSREDLKKQVAKLDKGLRKESVHVDADQGDGFKLSLEKLGVAVDVDKTVARTLEIGRTGNPIGRVWGALRGWVWDRPAPIELRIDDAKLREAVAEHTPPPKTASKEPSLSLKDGVFVAVGGRAGYGIDPDDVLAALPAAVNGGEPLKITVRRGRVQPQYSLADAEALAREANELDKLSLKVVVGEDTKTISPTMLAGWIDALPTPEALLLGVSGPRAVADLAALFPDVGESVLQTRYGISASGEVVVTPGRNGTACCDAEQTSRIFTAAIRRPPAKPIPLPLKVTEPSITQADIDAFAIKEVVGTFTTRHPCCAPRVTNIHRIADLVRGTVIRPHAQLSINKLIGPRTTAKGFVVDHVIEDGKFAEAVGGGISQFATTMFNAAFFAGLEMPEYQSHSIYISRYPRGREATLNYPHPDLIVSNNTPYGVLVWPTYSGTALTVTLYSTKHAPGTQTGQTEQKRGVCTQVITERTRTYPDGTKKKDTVRATYRPQEGINCDGSGSAVTSTTTPRKTTTTQAQPPPTTQPPPPPTTTSTP
ncbi:MAG TPA: VanW family protein [Acidimicrobiales bacterium]|nr:VanW family protein [Acidimicrobiales bacterium]